MVKIDNLIVQYPNHNIAYPNTEFKTNKVTFITGRNGVGKTSLLKAIGHLLPYQGKIESSGFVTYHFQEPVLFNRSVKDNILYPVKIRKLDMNSYHDTMMQYAKILHIDHLLDLPAKMLSSGEGMKVSLLRSIVFKPEVIMLDEPTTHLDLESIDQLVHLIQTLKQTMTFIIVSHNKAFIDALCDHVYHLGGSHVHR